MIDLRKSLCIFTAILFAVFALPAFADDDEEGPTKVYSLNMAPLPPASVAAGSSSTLSATFKNETPSGTSSINSLKLVAPAGMTITAASAPNGTVAVATGGGLVTVSNMTPVKKGQSFVLTLTATAAGSCTSSTVTWTATTWTGSSLSGKTFNLVNSKSSPTTAVAALCNYSLAVAPASVPVGTASPMTATFSNLSASTSSFNSVTLVAPTSWTITATLPAGWTASGQGTGTITLSSSTAAIAPGGTLAVPLQASVPCAAASPGNWSSAVGGGFSRSGPNPSTAVTGACALQFVQQPTSAVSGTPFSVQVQAVDGSGGPIASFAGPVTLALNGSATSFVPGTGSPSGGVVTISGVSITGLGQFSLTANSPPYPPKTSSAFTVFAGVTACGGVLDPAITNPGGGVFGTPGYAAGIRHDNKNGSSCLPADYTYANTILSNNTVQLTWDNGLQANAVFSYTVFFRPEFVDPVTGFPKRRTKVAWELDTYGNPIYVYGNACVSKDPPAPYTTLSLDNGGTLTVNPPAGTLPANPFAIVIGNERLTVTGVSGNTWTVIRGAGGTTAATHAAGDKVMSTPLPIDPNASKPGGGPNPYVGKQDRMCIWDEGYQTVPAGTYDCSSTSPGYDANNPVACILRQTSVFDLGDGFMGLE